MDAIAYLESLTRLITVEEFSQFTGISAKTLYRHIRAHRLPAIHIRGLIRLEPHATAGWLRERLS
jgi:excisionase family DNA binding protein